jgi:hypothetical protein
MPHRNFASFGFAVIAGIAAAGCSVEPPAAPYTTVDVDRPMSARAIATVGSYQLSFLTNGSQPVSTLPVSGGELILKAHAADAATGLPATDGTVTFEYCSLKRRPPNDITRADEAPLEALRVRGRVLGASGLGGSESIGRRVLEFRHRANAAYRWLPFPLRRTARWHREWLERASEFHLGSRHVRGCVVLAGGTSPLTVDPIPERLRRARVR